MPYRDGTGPMSFRARGWRRGYCSGYPNRDRRVPGGYYGPYYGWRRPRKGRRGCW